MIQAPVQLELLPTLASNYRRYLRAVVACLCGPREVLSLAPLASTTPEEEIFILTSLGPRRAEEGECL